MELRQMVAFKEVIERGGFTRASVYLHLTQSAVSQQIKALENELGATLLHRVGREVRPTDAGQLFLTHVKLVLSELENAQLELDQVAKGVKGSCRLACMSTIAPSILPQIIIAFRQIYPSIALQARVGLQPQLLAWVQEGKVDVSIVGLPIHASDLQSRVIQREEFVLMTPHDHAFATRRRVKLAELASENFILFSQDSLINTLFFDACRQEGFTPRVIFESDHLSTRLGMVAAGLGISLESRDLIHHTRFEGTVMVEFDGPCLARDVALAWRQNSHVPSTVCNLMTVLDHIVQEKVVQEKGLCASNGTGNFQRRQISEMMGKNRSNSSVFAVV